MGCCLDTRRNESGHADVRTTSVYMHSTNQQMNDAVKKLIGKGGLEYEPNI